MDVYDWFSTYLAASGSHRVGKNWQCPAHPDANPSLSVLRLADGRPFVHCFAGCPLDDVLQALGLSRSALVSTPAVAPADALAQLDRVPAYPPVVRQGSGKRAHGSPLSVVHHVYIPDEVRLERTRFADGYKTIMWEHLVTPDWFYGLGGRHLSDLPVYLAQEVLMAVGAGELIVLCESESSVDAFIHEGIFATTWAGGASAPQVPTLRSSLKGAKVAWIPDNDRAGMVCSQQVVAGLRGVCDLRTVLPEPGEDARDLLRRVGEQHFMDRVAAEFAPPPAPPPPPAPDASRRPPPRRPPELTDADRLAIEALHRAAGRVQPRGSSKKSRPPSPRQRPPRPGPSASPAKKPPKLPRRPAPARAAQPPLDKRPRNRGDVLVILGNVRMADLVNDPSLLRRWSRNPALKRMIGYREALIREVATKHDATPAEQLPAAIVQELERRARAVGRDSSTVLEGRNEGRLHGSSGRPADGSLHKKIGPIDNQQ